jgi:drug/metabolite transporter (DMT)-like permease
MSDNRPRLLSATTRGILLIAISSLVIAFVPSFAKLAYEGGATPQAVVAARYPVSFVVLIAIALITGTRIWPIRSTLRQSLLAGAFALIVGFGFMGSVAYIDVSLAILIFYLHPVFIGIYGHIAGSHRFNRVKMAGALIAIFGLALALAVDFDRLDPVGLGLAFMGAVGATVMILVNSRTTVEIGVIRANLQMTVFAGILTALVIPVVGNFQLPQTGLGWFSLVGAAAGITVGFLLFFAAVPALGATRATLISILEPVFSVLVALILIGETLTPVQWIGVALVVGGLFAIELPAGTAARIKVRLLASKQPR